MGNRRVLNEVLRSGTPLAAVVPTSNCQPNVLATEVGMAASS
jgi:hypothetical protein